MLLEIYQKEYTSLTFRRKLSLSCQNRRATNRKRKYLLPKSYSISTKVHGVTFYNA